MNENHKEKVAVLFGGSSAEHEISVITALQAIHAMDSRKYEVIPVYFAQNGKWYTGNSLIKKSFYQTRSPDFQKVREVTLLPNHYQGGLIELSTQKTIPVDICFLAFHGQFGEDGRIQGLLELADLPYTGCSWRSSSIAMNKFQSKSVVCAHGVPVLPSIIVKKQAALGALVRERKKILQFLSFPLFVKPNHLGSSIAIATANNEEELTAALARVFLYDDQALVEPCLTEYLEINVAVLDGNPPIASFVEMPIKNKEALSYEDKYLREGRKTNGSQNEGMAGLRRVVDPADLDPQIKERVTNAALQAFELLDCSGVCRFDFLFELATGTLYFNEVNPIPGSFAYYLWDKGVSKILFTELIETLLVQAKERHSLQKSLNKNFGLQVLMTDAS